MADVINTFASQSNDAPNVMIGRRMYTLAERHLAIGQFAQEYTLDNFMSKTMRQVRYKRYKLPTQTLVEGTPPSSVQQENEYVDITVEQWGIVSLLTDVSIKTLTHPVLQIAIERCSLAISELVEREQAKVLMTCSNVVYPSGATTRATITDGVANSNQRLSTDIVLQSTVQLRGRGAPDYEGGLYGGVMSPQHEGDMLSSDTTFQQSSIFQRIRKLEYAELGVWQGVQWVRGNFLPAFVGTSTINTAAANTTKPQVTIADTGGSMVAGGGNRQVMVEVVHRDITSDYERKYNTLAANTTYTLGSGITAGSVTVTTPTSTNYVYDIYITPPGATAVDGANAINTLYKVVSRLAANTTVVITASPAQTEETLVAASIPAASVSVFPGWVIGKDAFCRVKLNGMSMQSYLTPATASFSNPLAQAQKVGAKFMFKTAILDQNFLVRFETSSRFGNFFPS